MTSDKIVSSQKIETLLKELTLEEKVSLLSGEDFWTLPAIPRLGIPKLVVADGPTGFRSPNSEPATVFPVGVALAACWDPGLAKATGRAIGLETIAHKVDVLLAPAVNIQRTPVGGRNFETYSEDPLLASEVAIGYVEGVQSVGVGTSLKHFAANNQEHERMRASSNVGVRAMREIYLSAFESVVRQAKPWTVMGAYNKVNGTFACEHDELLNGILKDEWGFDGVVVSDWGATHSTEDAANHGLDLEMPGPPRHFGSKLVEAVDAGRVSQETLDDHVRRVLRLIERCGLLDGNPKSRAIMPSLDEQRKLARQVATEGIVLLRNEGSVLPLPAQTKSLAVIGALAQVPAIQGGGSSYVTPERVVTPLDGLFEAFGSHAEICFERGIDHEPKPPVIDGRLLSPTLDGSEHGLRAHYFDGADLSGELVLEETDWRLCKLGFGAAAQTSGMAFSVEWDGWFTPRYSGEHYFEITHSSPDVELEIDSKLLVGRDTPRERIMLYMIIPLNKRFGSVHLEAGIAYPIRIRYNQPSEEAIRSFNRFSVNMREPEPDREAAVGAAQRASAAVIFVGPGTTAESEGHDRHDMALSADQNQLVEDVAAANARTIVIVNSGSPVEMPWADKVAAIVQVWLPGQEGGGALADILSGKVSPGGKLPMTLPVRYEDNPSFVHYPGGLDTDYGEGIFVGYRYYDKKKIKPLFPFGHGLSYSQFTLSALSAPSRLQGGEPCTVKVKVTNSGKVRASETVQVYVEDRATQEAMPVRQLRGFKKIFLAPGDSATLDISLPGRAFSWFNPANQAWETTPGNYVLHVGVSSRDLRLSTELEIIS
tara:strand:- start:9504 stop:11972 length:2469 start_codon:yes stop_codon:yes gene_type:complete